MMMLSLRAAAIVVTIAGSAMAQDTGRRPPAAGGPVAVPPVAVPPVAVPMPSLAPVVDAVLPATVSISSVQRAETAPPLAGGRLDVPPNDLESGHEPGHARDSTVSLGSGFIIDAEGDIVTSDHLVGNTQSITVTLPHQGPRTARLVGRDPQTDIALLRIEGNDRWPTVPLGDSDTVRVGDWVVAIGSTFGLGGTVTAGIVSARGRRIQSNPLDDFLQIDAPINMGNSGGPALDMHGAVIGINTAIFSPNGGSVGVGFAIPINLAKPVIAELKAHGRVSRGWMGVRVQTVTPKLAGPLGLDRAEGAVVTDVRPDSPAAKAGVRPGDVIRRVNGEPLATAADLPQRIAGLGVGRRAELEISRDGSEHRVPLMLAEAPAPRMAPVGGNAMPAPPPPAPHDPTLGLEVGALTPEVRKRLQLDAGVTGVLIVGVAPDSQADVAGLEPGDVLQSVNKHPVTDPSDARRRITQAGGRTDILLQLYREGTSTFIALPHGRG